jgi:LemA protein
MSLAFLLVVLVVVALIVIVPLFWGIAVYNGLVAGKNLLNNAFAQIDVQLKRRYDLIPNLVETAKGYMGHERATLEAVIQARNAAFAAGNVAAQQPSSPAAIQSLNAAEGQLVGALGRLMAVAEAYPDLKANTNMLAIQEELTGTENRIAFARQHFNDSVMSYNTQREQFPANLIANQFGFLQAEMLQAVSNETERAVPKVSF